MIKEFLKLCDENKHFILAELESRTSDHDVHWELAIYAYKNKEELIHDKNKKVCIWVDIADQYDQLDLLFAKAYVFLDHWLKKYERED